MKRVGALLFMGVTAFSVHAQSPPSDTAGQTSLTGSTVSSAPDPRFKETIGVCLNLDVYPGLASKARSDGTSADRATITILELVKTRYQDKIPDDRLLAYSDVVKKVVAGVYAQPSGGTGNFDPIIFAACSDYKNYHLDEAALKRTFDAYVPAYKVEETRIPLCLKAAQTASTIALLRDNGTPKANIGDLAKSQLSNDPRTLAKVSDITQEVFDFPGLHPPTFFMYEQRSCRLANSGRAMPTLQSLAKAAEACQKAGSDEDQTACLNALLVGRPTP